MNVLLCYRVIFWIIFTVLFSRVLFRRDTIGIWHEGEA